MIIEINFPVAVEFRKRHPLFYNWVNSATDVLRYVSLINEDTLIKHVSIRDENNQAIEDGTVLLDKVPTWREVYNALEWDGNGWKRKNRPFFIHSGWGLIDASSYTLEPEEVEDEEQWYYEDRQVRKLEITQSTHDIVESYGPWFHESVIWNRLIPLYPGSLFAFLQDIQNLYVAGLSIGVATYHKSNNRWGRLIQIFQSYELPSSDEIRSLPGSTFGEVFDVVVYTDIASFLRDYAE